LVFNGQELANSFDADTKASTSAAATAPSKLAPYSSAKSTDENEEEKTQKFQIQLA